MNIAVILAGGIGSRVGAAIPKQFIEVLNRPILSYTIELFEHHPQVDMIEIVCRDGWQDKLNSIVSAGNFDKVFRIVKAGETFQDSVLAGIEGLKDRPDNDIILIHYGVSPFTSEAVISDAISVCKAHGNATPAHSQIYLAATNGDGKGTSDFLNRDTIMCLNSPQALKLGYARHIYAEGAKRGLLEKVDPHTTSLMYALGERAWFSLDETSNIKITTPQDLRLFEGWVLAQNIANTTGAAQANMANTTGVADTTNAANGTDAATTTEAPASPSSKERA